MNDFTPVPTNATQISAMSIAPSGAPIYGFVPSPRPGGFTQRAVPMAKYL